MIYEIIFCEYASLESRISNACYAIRDGNSGQRFATIESISSNACYAIRDGNSGQRFATIESTISNACHTVGDDCFLTTCNKRVTCSFYNCIAVVAAIVDSITFFYKHRGKGRAITENRTSNARHAFTDSHRGQRRAITENRTSNARYAVRDGDRGEGGAFIESIISNACHAIRDSHRGQRIAIMESIISNACHAVGSPVVSNGFGNCYRTRICASMHRNVTSSISNRCGLGTTVKIIPYTIYLRIGGVNSTHACE